MSPPFFLGAFTNSSSTTDAIIARARRNPPSPRRTSNLFRRQSAAKPLGFDPEDLSPSKYSFGSFLLPRPLVSFESRAARNDGPCLSRGIREQAAVCQGDYIPGPLLPNPPTNIKIPTYLRRAWHHHRFLRAISSSVHPFSPLLRPLPLLRLSSGPARNKRIRIRSRTLGLSWLFPTSVPPYMRAFQPAVEYERQLLLNGTQRYNGVGFSTTVSITRFIRLSRARVNRLIAWALFFLGYFACWWIASVNGRKDFSYEHVHTIHGGRSFIRQTGGGIGILFRIYRTENLTPVKYMSCTIILINFSFRFPLYLHNNVVRISDRVFIQLYVYNDFGLMRFNGNLMSWHYIFV